MEEIAVLSDAEFDSASIEELRRIALLPKKGSATSKQREIQSYDRSRAIRKYVLKRADGHCEGCSAPAPFLGIDGYPFLEAHHTIRRAEEGPDDLWSVIALCPNCHRRTDLSQDAKRFNESLIKRLTKLEPTPKKR
jgi:5-methylcytosine-specific restriction protein A